MKSRTFLYLLILIFFSISCSAPELTDPYEILEKNVEVTGGLKKWKNLRTLYSKGDYNLGIMSGSIETWQEYPDKNLTKIDLVFLKQQAGDNGDFSWSMDANGKIQILRDEFTQKKRRVMSAFNRFKHLDRDSDIFRVELLEDGEIDGFECYRIKISNNIDNTDKIQFIDKQNFLIRKELEEFSDFESESYFSDFREVNGFILPYKLKTVIKPMNQVQEVSIKEYRVNQPVSANLFNPPVREIQDFKFTKGNSAENISVDISDHIFIKVKIKDSEKLWVLDSGASMSVIDIEYAKKLNLKPQGQLKGQGAGELIDLSFVKLPSFSIPGIEFSEQTVVTTGISDIFKVMGIEIGGILGYDFLSRFVTKIDYANSKISFYDPDTFKYSGSGEVIDAPIHLNMFSIPITVDDKYTGKWRVDIGSNILSFHYPYAKENNLLDLEGEEMAFLGAGGYNRIKYVRFKKIKIGKFVLSKPLISVPYKEMKGAFASEKFIGNAGNSLFRHFILYLNYEKQQIILEKGADFDKPFDFPGKSILPLNRQLIISVNKNEKAEVLFVKPNSNPALAGFQKGDIVIEFDGKQLSSFPEIKKMMDLIQSPDGKKHEFVIERNEETITINMKLEGSKEQ